MDLALLVYAISTLENIRACLITFVFMGLILAIGFFAASTDRFDSEKKKSYRWNMAKRWLLITGCLGVVLIFIPSERTAYTMVGAYAAQRVSESPQVQQASDKVLKIIQQKLDNILAEELANAAKKGH